MGRIFCIGAFVFLALLLIATSRFGANAEMHHHSNPQKIVSLAPAITETLYALGLGDRVAGVTSFCNWPPEAAKKPKAGGFREVNLEAIASTGADLVILPLDMAHFKKPIEELGISVMLFNYQSLAGYLADVAALGALCDVEKPAAAFIEHFEEAMPRNTQKASVLFTLLNPDEYNRPIREATIIGADGFYNDIISAAGGKNAYTGKALFPRMSLEAMIALNPDIIVVGAPEATNKEMLEKRWQEIGQLKGTSNGRLLVLTDPGDTIPGPRSLGTIKKLSRAITSLSNSDREDAQNALSRVDSGAE